MPYASSDDVLARAGAFAGFFQTDGAHPDTDDLAEIIDNLSADIDAGVTARGFDPAGLSAAAQASLLDAVAYGALARGLSAAPVGADADDLKQRAWDVWNQFVASFNTGTNSVLVELEAGAGGQRVPGAGDFWSDEPAYPTCGDFDAARLNPFEAPGWAKGQRL